MTGSFRRVLCRLSAHFHRQPLDRELDAEITSHLEFAVEENIRFGMSPEEARRQALLRFGGLEQAREQHRGVRGMPALDILMQDLRFTFRTLRRDRAFTVIAILILGLGIGANIAVFSVVDAILLRPLPFHHPQRLVWISGGAKENGLSNITYSVDAYRKYQSQTRTLQAVTAYMPFFGDSDYELEGKGVPRPVTGVMVAGNFFQVLGIQPVLGRLFTAGECQKGGRPAVLLSYAFWKRQFGANPAIVGHAITLSHQAVTVVGVLPPAFDFGAVFHPGLNMQIFVPAIMGNMEDWGNTLSFIGRLKPGVGVAQAQAEANLLFPRLYFNLKHPGWGGNYTAQVTGLKDYVSGTLRRSLIVLWCAVGLILLIVCVNLSNLMLARAAARSREFAMRYALGAGRGRLIRQLLTESLVLSCAGAVLGLGLAFALTSWLAHQGSLALPLLNSVHVDGTALAWTLLVAVFAAVLFGLVPGLKISSGNLQEALKDSGHGASDGRKHERMRAVLVVSEIALACVLLIGAGLLLRSFLRIMDIDLGFQPGHAAALQIDYDNSNPERRSVSLREILDRVSAIPGIQAAGVSDMLPLDRNRSWTLQAKGEGDGKDRSSALTYMVTPGYLRAMGIHLLAGRDISWRDGPKSEPVIIVNKALADHLWPGKNAVGRTVVVNAGDRRVIGIVSNVRATDVEAPSGWQMYMPIMQNGPEGAELVVRTSLPPDALASSVMRTLRQVNPGQPATEFRPIQQLVNHAVSPRRFFMLLVVAFAVFGLMLACLGIYGVISYLVTRQTKEIGIRLALGATRAHVQLGVIRKTLRLAIIGIALGATASLAVAAAIASLLYDTGSADPATFACAIFVLALVALIAGYIPARRASRIDPVIALRSNG